MKRKRPEEYVPVWFAKTMIQTPESGLYDDAGYCFDFMKKHRDKMYVYGLSSSDKDCKNISRTLYMVRDWMRTKQAYKITKELADDLFFMDDLTFPANSLRLHFSPRESCHWKL